MTTLQAQTTGGKTSMPTTDGYILIAKIKPGQVDALRAAIAESNLTDPEGGLAQIATVHFARLVLNQAAFFDFWTVG